MRQPATRFARAGDVNIGFQVIGDGPVDLLWIWGLASNIETVWEEPSYAAFLRRLAESCRVILFDRRGAGVSDREGSAATPTLEERVEDALAVLDAAGSRRAVVFGVSEGGSLAAMLAATHPGRVERVIVYGTMARFRRDADHPWGWKDERELADFLEATTSTWGLEGSGRAAAERWAPSMVGDERFEAWIERQRRLSASRGAIGPLLWGSVSAYDVVDVFAAVHVPTLVLHRSGDRIIDVSHGRWIAEHIPGARFVELPGIDHYPFIGDAESVVAEIEAFVSGRRDLVARERRLLSILVADVRRGAGGGSLRDDAWRELLARRDDMVRDHLARFGGEERKRDDDAVVAMFDGPARAIRCALGIADGAERLGVELRLGLHTGECDITDGEVGGVALHVADSIARIAGPAEILCSSTMRDLVAGSGIRFGDERDVELDGVQGRRAVLEVLRGGATPEAVRRLAIDHANVLRRDGEYWTVAYGGLVSTVRDMKGLRDLARLVAAPRRELHVLDLLGSHQRPGATAAGPVLDESARARYRRRIADLEADIDDAEALGDSETAARARVELDALVGQLTAAFGLGGRARRMPDDVERARKTVTKRLRDARARIENVHPALGRHLASALKTGVFCSYQPDRDVDWVVEAG